MQDFTRLTGVAAFISSYFPAIFVYISGKVVRTKHTMRDVTQVDVRITWPGVYIDIHPTFLLGILIITDWSKIEASDWLNTLYISIRH